MRIPGIDDEWRCNAAAHQRRLGHTMTGCTPSPAARHIQIHHHARRADCLHRECLSGVRAHLARFARVWQAPHCKRDGIAQCTSLHGGELSDLRHTLPAPRFTTQLNITAATTPWVRVHNSPVAPATYWTWDMTGLTYERCACCAVCEG